MISLVDLENSFVSLEELTKELDKVGEELNVAITILPEDMFRSVQQN